MAEQRKNPEGVKPDPHGADPGGAEKLPSGSHQGVADREADRREAPKTPPKR